MAYAIIGSGKIGSALARLLARSGIAAAIANARGPDSIAPLVDELGGSLSAVPIKEALQAEVLFLAIPFAAITTFAQQAGDLTGKIVIDAMNAFNAPPELLRGRMSSEVVADALPGARVVKAFNHLPAGVLARDPTQDGGRRVIYVSSNDAGAASDVAALAGRLGFAPISIGRIDEGGRLLQVNGPLLLHNLVEHSLK